MTIIQHWRGSYISQAAKQSTFRALSHQQLTERQLKDEGQCRARDLRTSFNHSMMAPSRHENLMLNTDLMSACYDEESPPDDTSSQ